MGLVGLFVIIFVIGMFASSSDSDSSSKENKQEINTTTNDSDEGKPDSEWYYSTDTDEMSGNNQYFAELISENQIEFEFPYSGGSKFKIIVRNMENRNDVLLVVDKGQFMTSIQGSENIKIKFDDISPEKYSYSSSSDGSQDVVFLSRANEIIKKLKTSKKVMIEASFFQAGRKVIHFNTENFNWEN